MDLLRDPEALASMGDEMKADVASKIERCVRQSGVNCVVCFGWWFVTKCVCVFWF